jgi:hypothetical protein
LVTLTRDDLKDMGIELVGDQKAIMDELSQLKRAVVRVLRDQILWTVRPAHLRLLMYILFDYKRKTYSRRIKSIGLGAVVSISLTSIY